MKIALGSDLHLEFGAYQPTNQGADVLVLSGDVVVAQYLYQYPPDQVAPVLGPRHEAAVIFREFFDLCSSIFPHVVYVAGNHEFYDGRFYAALDYLKTECDRWSNIHFLEDDQVVIGNHTFVGSTLWTDMNGGDPITMNAVIGGLRDYQTIRNDKLGYTKIRAQHTMDRHRRSLNYIKGVVEQDPQKKYVVVTHMAPSRKSIHPHYQVYNHLNGAYCSDLDCFIYHHPQIVLWTHGHLHNTSDYDIGTTRVVCNPRGYVGYEASAKNYQFKYLEV